MSKLVTVADLNREIGFEQILLF